MTQRDIVHRGYDDLAETYAARTTTEQRRVDILQSVLDILPPDPSVLDIGCGHGTPALRSVYTATTVGVDLSREQLRLAREADYARGLVQGDAAHLPIASDAVDLVTAFDALIHVPLPDHDAAIAEMARVLSPGGTVLLSEAPAERERTTDDWLGSGREMRWTMAGVPATTDRLREAGFSLTNRWDPPRDDEGGPKPAFLAARLGTDASE